VLQHLHLSQLGQGRRLSASHACRERRQAVSDFLFDGGVRLRHDDATLTRLVQLEEDRLVPLCLVELPELRVEIHSHDLRLYPVA
jgi:hypothetical protein